MSQLQQHFLFHTKPPLFCGQPFAIPDAPRQKLKATHSKPLAAIQALGPRFLLASGLFPDAAGNYIACGVLRYRRDFLQAFSGGIVYGLSPQTFTPTRDANKTGVWHSGIPAAMIDANQTHPVPTLDAAIAAGAQIFFMHDGIGPQQFFERADILPATFEDLQRHPMLTWENGQKPARKVA